MKRLHVHVAVDDLDRSIGFYSTLFAARPTVVKPDYAKWMLEDPRVNFAISTRGGEQAGLDHIGIQVEDAGELDEVYGRLEAAEGPVLEQGAVTCCYHQSEKSWIVDPSGLRWEAFLTHGEATVYGDGSLRAAAAPACCGQPPAAAAPCCAPATDAAASCCTPAAAAE
ncbi:MAG: ArsI/CadI family heavy metal resistance metalloenzyme [Acetobacteraceae bacterium]